MSRGLEIFRVNNGFIIRDAGAWAEGMGSDGWVARDAGSLAVLVAQWAENALPKPEAE